MRTRDEVLVAQPLDGKEVVIAKSVVKGDQVLQLSDDNGVPLWAGCCQR